MNTGFFSAARLIFRFLRMFIFFLIAYAVMKAFPGPTETVSTTIEGNYLKSLLVGVIGLILIPALFIVLLATILGIPIAILLLPLIVIAAFVLGGTGIALVAGRHAGRKMGIQTEASSAHLALGIFLLELPSLLGRTTQFFSSFMATFFFILTLLVFIIAWLPGFGGVIISRFGRVKTAVKDRLEDSVH